MTREQAEVLGKRALAAGFDPSSCCHFYPNDKQWWPDFRDAATRGILLEQVREAWSDPSLSAEAWRTCDGELEWGVSGTAGATHGGDDRAFEAQALVAALDLGS